MQNDMVSIPSANMNGGLKAANNSSGNVVGVAGTVLTNAQRVYLTPASSYHLAAAARQTAAGVGVGVGVATAASANVGVVGSKVGNVAATGIAGGSAVAANPNAVAASTSGAGTAVRYFSQFSKLQPVQPVLNASVVQRKLINADTMVLVNGNSKPLIFAAPANNNNNNNNNNTNNNNNGKLLATAATTTAAAAATTTTTTTTTVPNGNRLLLNKQQQLLLLQQQQQQQQQLQLQRQQQQQQQQQQLQEEQQQPHVEDLIEEEREEEEQEQEQDQEAEHGQDGEGGPQQEPLALVLGKSSTDSDAEPELDIVINNVVCSFSVRCHLKLRDIALNGSNVEYRRENGMVTMKLRRPYTTASIWSSGRITCTGATSEAQAKIAARRYARCLGKLGFPTHFQNFRIVNVLGTCSMPWAIKIVNFSERHRDNASYEPELHPGVTYKMREPKATLKIFSTGSITVTAASVNDVESAIQHIYPLVHEFRKQRSPEELQHLRQKQRAQSGEQSNNELDQEQQLVAADAATTNNDTAKEDMFVNTTTAHNHNHNAPNANSNATRLLASASSLASMPMNASMRRLDQYKQYQQMSEQTQLERRHIPFDGVAKGASVNGGVNNSSNNGSSSNSSSSGGDNICANARRRATECWATKLQNKRPRYNDPGATSTTKAPTSSNTNSTTIIANSNNNSNSNSSTGSNMASGTTTATATTAHVIGGNGSFIAVNKLRQKQQQQPLLPVGVVLKQSSSRARNAAAAAAAMTTTTTTTTTTAAAAAGAAKRTATTLSTLPTAAKRDSYSPTEFEVDDLIEEDDDEDIDIRF
ncbi:hypothetical protein KR093_008309 [Drosophila rubida]|uniref:TATA box-binding protein-like 1 n=1 Tax=Drosophila rubida TaxID=30044 RepID=A0AAD4PSC7_9MUSC|nr:hypothetical protein KR093_008309 [Drosophila rubida]